MTGAARIAILDYGMGNLRSAEKALERVGAEARITAEAGGVEAADGVVLPGVGAFPEAMRRITGLGFDGMVRTAVERGTPVLGICLGMQLLLAGSSEHEGAKGLGLLEGDVVPLEAGGLKVPHIGWAAVRPERSSPLLDGIEPETPFYFVHSFVARPKQGNDVLGTALYGERFCAVVERPPIYGAQFHPEKSSSAGLRLLSNFAALCARAPAPA